MIHQRLEGHASELELFGSQARNDLIDETSCYGFLRKMTTVQNYHDLRPINHTYLAQIMDMLSQTSSILIYLRRLI